MGAGPAGMECARVLARRGMRRIHLVDRDREMGGVVSWISGLPGLGEWAWVTDHRRVQLAKHREVEFVGRTELTAAGVLDYGADIVVVATGSRWVAMGSTARPTSRSREPTRPRVDMLTPEQLSSRASRYR